MKERFSSDNGRTWVGVPPRSQRKQNAQGEAVSLIKDGRTLACSEFVVATILAKYASEVESLFLFRHPRLERLVKNYVVSLLLPIPFLNCSYHTPPPCSPVQILG